MTEPGFDSYGSSNLHYSYSWKYEKAQKMIQKQKRKQKIL